LRSADDPVLVGAPPVSRARAPGPRRTAGRPRRTASRLPVRPFRCTIGAS